MTATEHRVHGLAADQTPPDWPALTAAELHAVVDAYPPLRGQVSITWHSPRPLSAAARVRTSAGEIFVKRHHVSVRSPATLAEEHAFIAHLRAHGLPMPKVLADAAGNTAIARGDWVYEVHTLAYGEDVFRDTISWAPLLDPGQARTAGRMLAQLHRAAAGFDAPQRNTWILVARDDLLRAPNIVAALTAQLPARPGLAAYLQQRDWQADLATLEALHQSVQPRISAEPTLWTHNDWHVSNLFWSSADSNADITAVLDVGLASPTFALYDLATAIERNAIAWMQLESGMQAIHPHTANALIDGYAQEASLTQTQRHLLADLLPLVHISFALSEVEYYAAITGSRANADVAYDTFLLGHAAWFATPPGQAMLDAIRA